MPLRQGPLTQAYAARGTITYQIELAHDELHKVRVIKGTDADFVRRKAAVQIAEWEEQWSRKEAAENEKRTEAEQKAVAERRTTEAREALDEMRNLLRVSLGRSSVIDWNSLRNKRPFPISKPRKPSPALAPAPSTLPREPLATDHAYKPEFGFLDKLIPSRSRAIEEELARRYVEAHARWVADCTQLAKRDDERRQEHEQKLKQDDERYAADCQKWEDQKAAYEQQRQAENEAIDRQRQAYESKDAAVLVGYFDMVLSKSEYPDFCPKEFEFDYNSENGVLVVDYSLPAPDAMPKLEEVKHVASRAEFVEKELSQPAAAKLYDDMLYQITLRTIHELFTSDTVGALSLIVFNGYVRSIDRGTGKETNACVLSLQAARDEFLAINLANVDARACFKQLKGVGSSKLHSVAPVAPIMRIRREDGRFVSAHDVAYQLDDTYNLAAMDWEEFEHLIREIFEKEFTVDGGEVKVTQASRDGGVDAVAFDPDPIRGGKIVIQAKRYTNTVGVAAVRDLYGTVMNEGASKGILVTTSDYGPDAYAFANNKPLTLLNGANLLHLLEKHGHRAKIDLQAARLLAMEQKTN